MWLMLIKVHSAHSACEHNNAEMCSFLLHKGAEVKINPMTGQSPLHTACIMGHTTCVEAILQVSWLIVI